MGEWWGIFVALIICIPLGIWLNSCFPPPEKPPTPAQVCVKHRGVESIAGPRWAHDWVICRDGYSTDDVNLSP